MNNQLIQKHIKNLLVDLQVPLNDETLEETPRRVADFFSEVLSGFGENPATHSKTFPNEGGRELMVIKNIQFHSLCEHHLVPFFGEIAIGCVPDQKLLGLSKFVRIAEVFSKRLQLQERMTQQICDAVEEILEPLGCAVRVKATHMCMTMRGVKSDDPCVVTTSFAGSMAKNKELRREFLNHFSPL